MCTECEMSWNDDIKVLEKFTLYSNKYLLQVISYWGATYPTYKTLKTNWFIEKCTIIFSEM